jgi:hypothetical protein
VRFLKAIADFFRFQTYLGEGAPVRELPTVKSDLDEKGGFKQFVRDAYRNNSSSGQVSIDDIDKVEHLKMSELFERLNIEEMEFVPNPKVPKGEMWLVDPETGQIVGKIVNIGVSDEN